MNKKEFIKCCQLLANKEEFEQLKGTIKNLDYHLQNNFLSGLKLGVKHSLLEKFATDTFEIEKKTKLGFGDFYRQYFFHNAFNDESRMDLVKHKILAYYANALEAQGEWLHYLTFSEQGIQSEWEQMLSHNGKQASAAGEKLSKSARSFSATQEESEKAIRVLKAKSLNEAWNEFFLTFCSELRIPQFVEWLSKQLIKFESFLNRIKNK